jgi:hypothetical protein
MNPGTIATIKPGWGYWDTTHYPYKGCFRRMDENGTGESVVIVERFGKTQEWKVKFADGRRAVVDSRALQVSEVAQ